MECASLIERVVTEAKGEIPLSELVTRVFELSGTIPSIDEINRALAKKGREPVSIEAYANALIKFAPAVIGEQERIVSTLRGQTWRAAVGPIVLLTTLGAMSLSKSYYETAALPLGYALLYVIAILFPRSRLLSTLFSDIGVTQKANESLAHYQLKSGFLVAGMGTLFLVGSIWGRAALSASGVERGGQPALEVMLMIPMPLLGVTLMLWGLGKLFKGMVGGVSENSN